MSNGIRNHITRTKKKFLRSWLEQSGKRYIWPRWHRLRWRGLLLEEIWYFALMCKLTYCAFVTYSLGVIMQGTMLGSSVAVGPRMTWMGNVEAGTHLSMGKLVNKLMPRTLFGMLQTLRSSRTDNYFWVNTKYHPILKHNKHWPIFIRSFEQVPWFVCLHVLVAKWRDAEHVVNAITKPAHS